MRNPGDKTLETFLYICETLRVEPVASVFTDGGGEWGAELNEESMEMEACSVGFSPQSDLGCEGKKRR